MKTVYEFTECKVPGIWRVLSYLMDERTGEPWLGAPPDYTFGVNFSFDKEKIFSFPKDYPDKLTPEQIQIFNKAFPSWAPLKLWGGYPPDAASAQDSAPSIWDTRF